jgi:hypothetical protein
VDEVFAIELRTAATVGVDGPSINGGLVSYK